MSGRELRFRLKGGIYLTQVAAGAPWANEARCSGPRAPSGGESPARPVPRGHALSNARDGAGGGCNLS